MLGIESVNHVGIRISDRARSTAFYERLGFEIVIDGGYDAGHPIVMRHPSGLVFNLLGQATSRAGENVLMDEREKFPGITHPLLFRPAFFDPCFLCPCCVSRKVTGIAISRRSSVQ